MQTNSTDIREASRQLVRELGMLAQNWAETRCSTSQCHALLELDRHGSMRPSDIADLLLLDRSTTSRLVASLKERGLLLETPDHLDGRTKWLSLSAAGKRQVAKIDAIADRRVLSALSQLSETDHDVVLSGIRLYANALRRSRNQEGYDVRLIRPEDNAAVAQLIRSVMTEHGAVGEGYSINDPEVDAMANSYSGDRSRYWVIVRAGEVVGGGGFGPLAGAPETVCELRKMYLQPELRGRGFGARLLGMCLSEARTAGYEYCYLETIPAMAKARRLYESFGFERLDKRMGSTGHSSCGDFFGRSLV